MKTLKHAVLAVVVTVMALQANAQKWGATPEDSVRNITNYALYTQFYKQKSYEDAYTPWKALITDFPQRHKNDYIQGATILKNKINIAKTAADRDSALAELMALYDQRSQYFGEKSTNIARKALDLETFKRDVALKEYYALYAQAIEVEYADPEEGAELEASYVFKFFEATVKYVNKGYADSTLVVDNYDLASELMEKELEKEILKEQAGQKNKADEFRKYVANIEAAFSPYAGCEQLVAIYSKKFASDKNNVDLLKKITNIMMKKGCTEEPLFFEATENLYALEPTPLTAMRMGQMCFSKKKYSEAVKYLSDATKSLDDPKDQYKAYILLGHSYSAQNNYSSARSAFNRAAEINPTTGEPYIQIAYLYAAGSRSVSDGMNGRSAYWAAVDKANKAKSIDSSEEITEAANRIIGQYSAYYPQKADAFMLGLKDGDAYVVPGWIGESTRVRTR